MTRELPDPQVVRKLLRYEPDTGKLFWLERDNSFFNSSKSCNIWNGRYCGKEALSCINSAGYYHGSLLGRNAKAHRVAWCLFHGTWPKDHIDHINGNPLDNRILNLRDVTRSQNMRNRKQHSNNTSGVRGVGFKKAIGKWSASIRHNNKQHHLGVFVDIADAEKAYLAASSRLHGKYGIAAGENGRRTRQRSKG